MLGSAEEMGGASWLAAPASVLSLVLMSLVRGRKGSKKGKKDDAARVSEDEGVSFTCERVCTSDALLTRLGGLVKVRARNQMRLGRELCLPVHLILFVALCVRACRNQRLVHASPCAGYQVRIVAVHARACLR